MTDVALPRSGRRGKRRLLPATARSHARTSRSSRERGSILVAIAPVALIVAIAANKLWPLMFLHVAGGAAWTIIDLFLGLVLGPIIGRMSIPARIEFTTRLMPKMRADHADRGDAHARGRLAARRQAGDGPDRATRDHGWVVASFIVVGVMSVIALGLLEPANIAVLIELKKPPAQPRR